MQLINSGCRQMKPLPVEISSIKQMKYFCKSRVTLHGVLNDGTITICISFRKFIPRTGLIPSSASLVSSNYPKCLPVSPTSQLTNEPFMCALNRKMKLDIHVFLFLTNECNQHYYISLPVTLAHSVHLSFCN